jgi:hypothetical protein
MKLTKETIEILRNFSTINQSILFKEGSKVRTMSPQKNVFAEADVAETFPMECAIYELPRLLSILPLFESPELEFSDNYITISSKKSNHKVRYFYASKTLIVSPPDKSLAISTNIDTFDISKDDLAKIIKASALMQLPHMVVGVKDGARYIKATNMKSKSSNDFMIKHGESDSDDYEYVLKTDNLKLLPDSYSVVVGKIKEAPLFRFESEGIYHEVVINGNVYSSMAESDKAEELKGKLESEGKSVEIVKVVRPTTYFVMVETIS